MKKTGLRVLLLGAVALLVLLGGCELVSRDFYSDEPDDPTKGSLILLLDGAALPTKTIGPPASFSMDVGSYDLTFTDPSSNTWTETVVLDSGVFLYHDPAATAGSWNVQVRAYNSGDVLIGAYPVVLTDSFAFTVNSGNNIVNVSVFPIDGTGHLALNVNWPASAVEDARIAASLIPAPGNLKTAPGDAGDISSDNGLPDRFVLGALNATTDQATYDNDALGTGYYTLTLRLYDDHDGQATTSLAWGWVEAVRIIDFATSQVGTTREWPLMGLTGDLEVYPNPDGMQNPVEIVLSGPDEITQGNDLAVIATCDPEDTDGGEYTYQCYLDGDLLTEGEVTITFNDATTPNSTTILVAGDNADLTVGNHNLSVLIISGAGGTTLSSKTHEFSVVAATP